MAVLAVPHPRFFARIRTGLTARPYVNLSGQRDLSTDFLQMGSLVMAQLDEATRSSSRVVSGVKPAKEAFRGSRNNGPHEIGNISHTAFPFQPRVHALG